MFLNIMTYTLVTNISISSFRAHIFLSLWFLGIYNICIWMKMHYLCIYWFAENNVYHPFHFFSGHGSFLRKYFSSILSNTRWFILTSHFLPCSEFACVLWSCVHSPSPLLNPIFSFKSLHTKSYVSTCVSIR